MKLLQRKLWEISRKIYVIEFPFSKVVSLHSKVYYQFTKFTTGTFLEVQAFWYIVQGILNILDNVQEKLCYVVVFSKLQVFNYSLQPNLGCFKLWKIPEITGVWVSFLQKQVLTASLQNSCSKELFGKLQGRPASVCKKIPTLDVSLEIMQIMQKCSEHLCFQNTMNGCFRKLK